MRHDTGEAPNVALNGPALLTAAEVAERLSVCRSTVYNLIAAGTLPAHRFGKGKIRRGGIRVPEGAVNALLSGTPAQAA